MGAEPVSSAARASDVRAAVAHADVAALTHTGLVRDQNEDAHAVFRVGRYLERITSNIAESELPSHTDEVGLLMMIADGMGGHQSGEVASRGALTSAVELILASPRWAMRLDDPDTREREVEALMTRTRKYLAGVHARIRQRAAEDAALSGMGTTFTGAYAIGRDLFLMHVGDSKAYLLRGGRMQRVTHDHTLAQEYADLGMIAQEEVATHRMHHVLTRAIGGPDDQIEADVRHLQIDAGDRLLLCSDGLTDMAGEDEIAAVLGTHAGSLDACQALVDLALQRGGRDNITVIVTGFPRA